MFILRVHCEPGLGRRSQSPKNSSTLHWCICEVVLPLEPSSSDRVVVVPSMFAGCTSYIYMYRFWLVYPLWCSHFSKLGGTDLNMTNTQNCSSRCIHQRLPSIEYDPPLFNNWSKAWPLHCLSSMFNYQVSIINYKSVPLSQGGHNPCIKAKVMSVPYSGNKSLLATKWSLGANIPVWPSSTFDKSQ